MSDSKTIDEITSIRKRLIVGFVGVFIVVLAGAAGYYILGHGDWSFINCIYMTAITISTVGFSEIIDVSAIPGARLYTIFLIMFGMGIILYFGSTVVALVVEADIKQYLWRRRIVKEIEKLSDHIIVCGAGVTGRCIIKELLATRTPFVAVDEDEERLRMIVDEESREFPYLVGDAADDNLLIQAGIHRARGFIAALPEDKDNLFIVVSARQLNSGLRIVSRGIEQSIAEKLKRAGADAVVSPNFIGGMRMVSEMIRPNVVEFLDLMLKDKESNLRVEEVTISKESSCAGKSLGEADMRRMANVLVLAVRDLNQNYIHNPHPDFILEEGMALIILAAVEEVIKLRTIV